MMVLSLGSILHFGFCCMLLQYSIGCFALSPRGGGGGGEACLSSCYVQGEFDDQKDMGVCQFHYVTGECDIRGGPNNFTSTDRSLRMDSTLLKVESSPIDGSNTAVTLSFQVDVNDNLGEVMLVLNGITGRNDRRCFVACFRRLTPKLGLSTLRASCVKLPNGRYVATVLGASGTARGTNGEDTALCSSPSTRFPVTSDGDVVVLTKRKFSLSSPYKFYIYPWTKKHHQMKRSKDDSDMPLKDLLGLNDFPDNHRCLCYGCIYTSHLYDNSTALLQLSYSVNSTQECCNDCSSLNLALYQYVAVTKDKDCAALNFTAPVISGLRLVTQDKNVTQGPIEYPNVGTGCYAIRLRPMGALVNPSPIYHGFFWLNPTGNVTNMNDWNTTFYLQPYPDQGSLEVKWTAPTYPYNFSHYDLQLWHHGNFSIKCRGENLYDRPIIVIPESGKISLSSTSHHFENLSSGWYCARVTPVDPRCPPDGCEPRSSLAKLLKDSVATDYEPIDDGIAPILVLAGAGVLVAGVVLACVVLRCRASHNFFNVTYTKVNTGRRLGDTQEVLLVWTAAGADGVHLLPVIQAFKKILTSYGRCKVYDYLDLRSLPGQQREHLLASPTAWLDGVLCQQRVKIIVVGTEGGRNRQLMWMTPTGGRSEVASDLQPQDAQLFPYLLRRLQDRPDLAADYSRVFHVRFNDISDTGAELEGVVSWTRYRLPQHLRSLIIALHGIREEDGNVLEDPTGDTIQPLQKALASHPLYSECSTLNKNSNNHSIHKNNSNSNHCNTPPSQINNKIHTNHSNSPTQNHCQSKCSDIAPCVPIPFEQDSKPLNNHISDVSENGQLKHRNGSAPEVTSSSNNGQLSKTQSCKNGRGSMASINDNSSKLVGTHPASVS